VLGVVVLLALYLIVIYNRLVRLRALVREAWSGITVQLRRRADLIPNLVRTVEGYATHERETLEAVTAHRTDATTAKGVGATAQADAAFTGMIGKLFAVAEAYPELKADAAMRSLGEELTSTENRVGFARQAYNDEVLAYNDAAAQFPGLLVARVFGFEPAGMLQSTQNADERQAPRVAF
jgi:LemA protein